MRPPYDSRALGLTALRTAEYLILLAGRELQGRFMGHEIYRATQFEILPLHPNASVEDPPHPVEAHLLSLVRSHLQTGTFLFSYTWDLTRRLQSHWKGQDEGKGMWELVGLLLSGPDTRLTFLIGRRQIFLE